MVVREFLFPPAGPMALGSDRQSGFPDLKYADLISDTELILNAKEDAKKMLDDVAAAVQESYKTVSSKPTRED